MENRKMGHLRRGYSRGLSPVTHGALHEELGAVRKRRPPILPSMLAVRVLSSSGPRI
ncbi:hypothetical protein [Noviherbaspirillum sedimenti]|uniref:hypothetical protein n=1 Tax=Noviherbaspirillum sedimenti TaxID=2320865 RepID=UPI0013145F63|nr:hypothetical protein [Noviherbaspirillum sedimenti]